MMKTVSIAAIVAMTATSAFAGSLADTVIEAPAEQEIAIVPAGSSGGIGIPVVIGGLLAAGAVAAIVSNNNDSDTDTPED